MLNKITPDLQSAAMQKELVLYGVITQANNASRKVAPRNPDNAALISGSKRYSAGNSEQLSLR